MTEQYKKEEGFLRVVANAYISHCPDELLTKVPDDFGFDTMWRYEYQITNKELYKKYIYQKLSWMKMRLITSEFAMMKDKRDGKPLLLITNSKSPDGGQAVFIVKTDKDGNVKRMDITAADFFPMEPMSTNNTFKRTHQTLLELEPHCHVIIKTKDKKAAEYDGVVCEMKSWDSAWGLGCIDDIPDDFCKVYDNIIEMEKVGMFTKDTRFAVDFVFIDTKGQIIKIHKNAAPMSKELIECIGVGYVIEMKAGQCEKHGIEIGDIVEFDVVE